MKTVKLIAYFRIFTIFFILIKVSLLTGMGSNFSNIHNNSCLAAYEDKHNGNTNIMLGCELNVDFDYKISDNVVYLEAHTNADLNTSQFIWDMGDGTKLKGASIKHQYTQKRDYQVCLTVVTGASSTTVGSCTEMVCKNIKLINGDNPCGLNPDFKFEEKDGILYAAGTSSAGDRAVYIWKISDGTQYRGKEFKHAFKSSGTYEICLTVVLLSNITDNKQCSETVCKKVRIDKVNQPCDINADFKLEIKDGILHAIGFSNAGDRASYIWKISDGTRFLGKEVKHQFKTPGEYEVCLTVVLPTITANDIRACSKTICKKIKIDKINNPCDLIADIKFEITDNILHAAGYSNAGDKARYLWKISDGTSYNGKEIKHKFKKSGTYEICLTVVLPSRTLQVSVSACNITICKKIDVRIDDTNDADCTLLADFEIIKRNSGTFLIARSNAQDAIYKWKIEGLNQAMTGKEISLPATDFRIQKVCLVAYSEEAGCSIEVCKEIRHDDGRGRFSTSNPFTDLIRLTTEQPVNAYILYDQYQHIVKQQIHHSGGTLEIDSSDLPAGIYYLKIQFEDGSVGVKKLIKL